MSNKKHNLKKLTHFSSKNHTLRKHTAISLNLSWTFSAEVVGKKILTSFDSLPTATIESVYANSLSDEEDTSTALSYLDRVYYAMLKRRYGTAVDDLDDVLRTYFSTRVTKYTARFLTGRKTFQQVEAEVLAEERARLNVGNNAAAAFWNGVNTLRGYRRPIIRYGVQCYSGYCMSIFWGNFFFFLI